MEEKKNKYQNGKIYKIIDNGYNMVYYGSTINRLCQRMALHRQEFKKNNHKYSVSQIFKTYGIENCKIELVENYPCNNRNELEAREGYFIKNNDCINKFIAGRTQKEYYEDNKDKRKLKMKEYQQANKDKMKEYQKKYLEKNKDKIKEQTKKYRLNKIKQYKKAPEIDINED